MAEPAFARLPGASGLPRAGLLDGPSPLELWPALSRHLGVEIWAKRDDLLPHGLGGNKLRKLDLILGRALQHGSDTVITHGGVQSNHCRLTAAVAARLGLRCILVLHGERETPMTGNRLLDELFGAEVDFAPDTVTARTRMGEHAERVNAEGGSAVVVPLGGSDAWGSAGYLLAADELDRQCTEKQIDPAAIYVTLGSGGTVAGLAAGMTRFRPQCRMMAVNVAALSPFGAEVPVAGLAHSAADLLGLADDVVANHVVVDEYTGAGYGVSTEESIDALRLIARCEGVLLDPVYTAKTMAALIGAVRSGAEPAGPLVFWHTGGAAALFARDPDELLGRRVAG